MVVLLAPRVRYVYDLGLTNCTNGCIVSIMTNHEHPSMPDSDLPDQADRPYGELGPAAQTYLKYIAAGRFDPLLSIEDLREIDRLFEEMFTGIKSIVYDCLAVNGVPPTLDGLPPELQLAVRVFTEQYLAEQYHNDTPPPDIPPSPETPQ